MLINIGRSVNETLFPGTSLINHKEKSNIFRSVFASLNNLFLLIRKLKNLSNLNIPKCFIKGEEVERVDCYKYLGTIIDDKLLFDMNCDMIF